MVLIVAALTLAACGNDSSGGSSSGSSSGSVATSTSIAGTAAGSDLPQGDDPVDLDPATFTADITNPYWPMEPGTRWSYTETGADGTELEIVVTVTDETKELANGITARVVRDTVTEDGELIEDTLDWYAQDDAGNVWYMGEDTAEIENGEITTKAGSFEAGVDGALPGIIMPADPQPGMKYRQEYFEGEAEDNGEILSVDEMAEVSTGFYDDAVLTKDTITLEPDVLEYKLYARDVGPVLVFGVSGGSGVERLVKIDQAPAGAGTGPLGTPNE
ncbi:MAG: hypothetical protein M5U31_03765 [Acidimicrobiia bacterium]|nr:hypothetical protein [Acidimicrobiia bacterium]